MINISEAEIRSFLVSYILKKLEAQGRKSGGNLPDDYDFLMEGAIDSLGVLKLTKEIQEHFGVAIDFEDIDPEKMTLIGPLCSFVSDKINK